MNTFQEFDTVDVLKLEVAGEWTRRPNLVLNPSGEDGGFGWLNNWSTTKPAWPGDLPDGVEHALRITKSDADHTAQGFVGPIKLDPEQLAVGGVKMARGQIDIDTIVGVVGDVVLRVGCYYLLEDGVSLAATYQDATRSTPGRLENAFTTMPPTTVYVQMVVLITGPEGARVDFHDAILATASIYQSLHLLGPLEVEPPWVDVLGPTLSITIDRPTMDLGVLTATIRDSELDPSQGGIVRPGKKIRLRALENPIYEADAERFERIYTGTISEASVTFDLLAVDPGTRPKIVLTAVDTAKVLANLPRAGGVGTLLDLPKLLGLGGKSDLGGIVAYYQSTLAWNINGVDWFNHDLAEGSDTYAPVAYDDNANALDQVVMARDAAMATAWVDRHGVVQVQDNVHLYALSRSTFDEDFYGPAPDLGYNTTDCINSVTIKFRYLDPETDPVVTKEDTYGPYEDEASVRTNGANAKEFTIQGDPAVWLAEIFISSGGIDTPSTPLAEYGKAILAANAIPELRLNAVSTAVTGREDFRPRDLEFPDQTGRVHLDLYDRVDTKLERAGIDGPARIRSISHNIQTDKWLITYGLISEDVVAAPQRLRTPALR